jgi:hypothetical protein
MMNNYVPKICIKLFLQIEAWVICPNLAQNQKSKYYCLIISEILPKS